jgi:sialate O-acetylesterase
MNPCHNDSNRSNFQPLLNELNMNKSIKFFLLLVVLTTTTLYATVKPSSLFANHIVLQRNVPIPVWGTANPGEKVTVTLNNAFETVTADVNGKWMIRLPKQKAGGPYKMDIFGDNTITVNDVYIGEVWLCSGQSNMVFTVAKEDRYWCGVKDEAKEVAAANYPPIRVFNVDYTPSNTEKANAVSRCQNTGRT